MTAIRRQVVPIPPERSSRSRQGKSLIEIEEESTAGAQQLAAASLAGEVLAALDLVMSVTHVSQSELSARLSLTEGAVSQVVHGDGNVRVSTIGRYLRALGYQAHIALEAVVDGLPHISPESRANQPVVLGRYLVDGPWDELSPHTVQNVVAVISNDVAVTSVTFGQSIDRVVSRIEYPLHQSVPGSVVAPLPQFEPSL